MAQLDDLIPELQSPAYDLFSAAHFAGLRPQLTSSRRTSAQQARLYSNYLKGLSSLPALPPGLSAHEYGLAFDLITYPMSALEDVGYTWQTWGGEWGGLRDPVHFQQPGAEEYIKNALRSDSWARKALGMGVDVAISFIPGVGEVETAASLLQLYPPWSHSAVLDFLSGPAGYLLKR